MKTLPKTIRPHTAVKYTLRSRTLYGEHTPSCTRGKGWLQVTAGYDHEAQAFTYRRVTAQQVVCLGENARKPIEAADYREPEVKKIEAIKKRYPKNFQARDRVAAHTLRLDQEREIEFRLDKRAMTSWLKQCEKTRNQSPKAPADAPKAQPQVKRIIRKNARKRFHRAVSIHAVIGSK